MFVTTGRSLNIGRGNIAIAKGQIVTPDGFLVEHWEMAVNDGVVIEKSDPLKTSKRRKKVSKK